MVFEGTWGILDFIKEAAVRRDLLITAFQNSVLKGKIVPLLN
jgi:hypothetical protein